MYRAKAAGRQRFALFDEGLHEDALRQLELEGDLRRAVQRNEFEPYYQPIVRLSDGAVVGYEALMRWQNPERGCVEPGAVPRHRRGNRHAVADRLADLRPGLLRHPHARRATAPTSPSTCRRGTCARTLSASACWRCWPATTCKPVAAAPGGHRRRAAGEPRPGAAVPGPVARGRRADPARRFRHRLFLAVLPAPLPAARA